MRSAPARNDPGERGRRPGWTARACRGVRGFCFGSGSPWCIARPQRATPMPHDARYVLGTAAQVSLLRPAENKRRDARSAAQKHRTDALGAVEFMGGYADRVGRDVACGGRQFAGGLHRVDVDHGAGIFGDSGQSLRVKQHAGLVVGGQERGESRVVIDGIGPRGLVEPTGLCRRRSRRLRTR